MSVALLKAYQQTAEHLTSKPVVVRLRQPVDADALGCTYRARADYGIIDIAPKLPPLQQLMIFLHEVAHCKLHLNTLQKSDVAKLPSHYFKPGDKGYSMGDSHSEKIEANDLRDVWFMWAVSECSNVVDERDPQIVRVMTYLKSLEFYEEG